jgi:uncharacterized protein YuzE
MKLKYYQDTDSLYIDLSLKTSVDSYEVSRGVVVDLDENNNIVGIDIDNASNIIELNKLVTEHLPLKELSQVM